MKGSIKTRVILMLDHEFEKTVDDLVNIKKQIQQTNDFRMIAALAIKAAELEDYADVLLGQMQEVLEG